MPHALCTRVLLSVLFTRAVRYSSRTNVATKADGEGRATVRDENGVETEVDLRLDWANVKSKLAAGGAPLDGHDQVDEGTVLREYALEDLDPTQRRRLSGPRECTRVCIPRR